MRNCGWILVVTWILVLAGSVSAEAAWVKPNKKPVSSWEGFQNSANGAITNLLPWNWVGKRDKR